LIVARTNTFLFLFVLASVCGEIVENASQITSARSQPDIAKLAAMVLNAYDAAILRAMSGWLRADVICDAFSTISPQTEANTKRNKNVFVRATINVKWSPKQAPGPTVRNAPSSAESLFEKGP
jgi:hypothetical protein